MVLQLRHWDARDHPHMGDPALKHCGNGVVLWFSSTDVEAAFNRAKAASADILEPIKINPNANCLEFRPCDLDSYSCCVKK